MRQYLWLFEEAVREGVEDYLILSGDHLYRMVRPRPPPPPPPPHTHLCF